MKQNKVLSNNIEQSKKDIREANLQVDALNTLLICCKAITGDKKLFTLEEIESFIADKTGFKNVEASSDLLGVKDEFLFIKDYYSKEWRFRLQDFQFKKNLYSLGNLRDKIIESNTERITDEEQKMYEDCLEICNSFNKLKSDFEAIVNINPYSHSEISSIIFTRFIDKLRGVKDRFY